VWDALRYAFYSHHEPEKKPLEVIAGARRLRAAELGELKNMPVRIVKLTDAAAIETQCVESSVVGKIFLCYYAGNVSLGRDFGASRGTRGLRFPQL
jgi:hypothetical protein